MKKRTFNILLIGACAACIGTVAVGFGSCKDSVSPAKTEISNKAPVLPEKEENITKINDNDLLNMVKQESGNTASGAEAGAETGNAGNSTGNSGAETGETVSGANTSDLENTIKNYAGDLFAIGQSAEMALTDNDATSGITFTAKINAYYDTAAYGMFVVPYTLVKNLPAGTDYIANIYSRLPEAAKEQIALPYNTCIPYEINENNYISVSLVDIKGANFDLDYVAIPYVEFKGEETVTRYYTAAVENNAACVSEVLADTYGKLAETEKTYAERMATRAVTCFKGSEGALAVVTSDGESLNNTTVYKSAEGLTVKEHDGVPVKFSTESEAIEIDEKTGVVTIKNSAKSVTINAAFCQYTASATFDIAGKTLVIQNTALNLLENKTVDGTVNTKNVNATVAATYKGEDNEDLGLATGVQLKSNNETVAKVNDGGIIEAVSSGETVITATAPDATNTVDISVTVWVGIATPADMDALSLITYYNDKTTAQTLLSKNYLLMNDIDYSTHVRNFILPIASPSGGLYSSDKSDEVTDWYFLNNGNFSWAITSTVRSTAPLGTESAHYSFTWKAILGLTDATETISEQTVHYLKDSNGNEFKGINPHLVKFSGVLNGNGYSVKNAWLMADNFIAKIPNNDGEANTMGAAACFIGINNGTITNIGFENINIPNRNVSYTLSKTDGLKTEMQYEKYWHGASAPTTLNGTYGGLASGSYVKTNSGGSTSVGWRWNGSVLRSFGSALIVSNYGTLNNVYFDYVSCSAMDAQGDGKIQGGAWSNRGRGDGLVFVNVATISNCLVVRHDPKESQLSSSFTLTAEKYATGNLIAYSCISSFGGNPTIENVGAYNDTTANITKVEMPQNYTNPEDGSGITALSELPAKEGNSYVSLTHLI